MQEPFPVLTYLYLNVSLDGGSTPVLPANFLGGSAPCLRTIHLRNIPFPAIPLLLLSASGLVQLELRNIPLTGYISPEAMVASLAALPKLEIFVIEFRSATSRPDLILPPPVTRTVLPSLTYFEFQGASEYLEDLVARIDGPQLDRIFTIYLNLVDIEVAQLSRFINRSVGPELDPDKLAHFAFYSTGVGLAVYNHACPNHRLIWNSVICGGTNWQVSQIAQVLSRISAAFSNVVHLKLGTGLNGGRQLEGTDDVEWLLLPPPILHHVTAEMIAEVLPSLDLICIEGQRASSIEKFVTGRRVSGRPVTITNTEMEFSRRLKSYVRK
ncbi:hypothetical protein EDB86DRAFT_3106941 [Lactarius hatsudake]|nr:hypothetical protein EDB86DRAFT_3106941 [Lactarius hatsudake]